MVDFEELKKQVEQKKAAQAEQPVEEEQLGYIDWWEFAPQKDMFVVRSVPDKTKKQSESGIIITTQTDVIMDRPFKGEIISTGPDSKYKVGSYIYWEPQKGLNLEMIRKTQEGEIYLLLYDDAVLGQRVKDVRG